MLKRVDPVPGRPATFEALEAHFSMKEPAPMQNDQLLLQEIHALRERVESRFDEIAPAIARLETQMTTLVGNGKPGRVTVLEEEVEALKLKKSWLSGYVAFVVSATAILLAVHDHILHYFHLQ